MFAIQASSAFSPKPIHFNFILLLDSGIKTKKEYIPCPLGAYNKRADLDKTYKKRV